MKTRFTPFSIISIFILFSIFLAACQGVPAAPSGQPLNVLAVESFLADITRNIAGTRLNVDSLIPTGLDPHAFEPAPADVARIASAQVLIINGAGLEEWLQKTLDNAGGQHQVITASTGLSSRNPTPGEPLDTAHPGDPHFWLDPLNAVRYVENIRDGLIQSDPAGRDTFTANAADYITKLRDLDTWVISQVSQVPPARRLLVTNHESLGYFADHYGFKIVGVIIPSVSTDSSPSAAQFAALVDAVRTAGAPAVFLETGANPQLASQLAQETGVRVVTGLYTHSTTTPDGPAPTYIDMIKANVNAIVEALK